MQRRIFKYFLIVSFLLFTLTNFTYLRFFLPQSYPHRFCSDKCRFWTYEKAKGHDPVGSVVIAFERYKKETNQPDLVLYRRTPRKWWQVWNWVDFLTHKRWSYPYAETDEET